jgi:hypothetical protein
MRFLIDDENKVIFGWSAKCACSHVKKLFYFLNEEAHSEERTLHRDYNVKLPGDSDISDYVLIVFTRNPYQRLVSGFLEKYNPYGGTLNQRWGGGNLTFSLFVEELVAGKWDKVENHHFTPQTSEGFNFDKMKKSKELIVYDIKNIDYGRISQIYNKAIPQSIIDFRGEHSRKANGEKIETNVYDMELKDIFQNKVEYNCFYNDEIKGHVYQFYKRDFVFCNLFSIHYNI